MLSGKEWTFFGNRKMSLEIKGQNWNDEEVDGVLLGEGIRWEEEEDANITTLEDGKVESTQDHANTRMIKKHDNMIWCMQP